MFPLAHNHDVNAGMLVKPSFVHFMQKQDFYIFMLQQQHNISNLKMFILFVFCELNVNLI